MILLSEVKTPVGSHPPGKAMSKNEFKRIKKSFEKNPWLSFEVVDYNNKYPNSNDAEFILMGESAEVTNAHCIYANVDIKQQGIKKIEEVDKYLFRAKIQTMEFNAKYHQADIHVTEVKALPLSIITENNEEVPTYFH